MKSNVKRKRTSWREQLYEGYNVALPSQTSCENETAISEMKNGDQDSQSRTVATLDKSSETNLSNSIDSLSPNFETRNLEMKNDDQDSQNRTAAKLEESSETNLSNSIDSLSPNLQTSNSVMKIDETTCITEPASVESLIYVIECPVCQFVFSFENTLLERSIHLNQCLDDAGKDPVLRRRFSCRFCDMDFTVLSDTSREVVSRRLRHLKTCAKSNGVTNPTELSRLLADSAFEEIIDIVMDEEVEEIAPGERNMNEYLVENQKRLASAIFKPSKKTLIKPPFCKSVPGANGFVVDGFRFTAKYYLLTHFHSDHYHGITSHFSTGIIVCTPATAKLLVAQYKVPTAHIKQVSVKSGPLHLGGVDIHVLHANHCPGAIIFLLYVQKTGKWHLHTGDFRFDPSRIDLALLAGKKIDTVFLDTTYCDPKYTFMSQDESINEGIRQVKLKLGKKSSQASILGYFKATPPPMKILFLFGTYSIGKELFFLQVVKHCFPADEKISVSKTKLKLLECCKSEFSPEDFSRFTTNSTKTQIRIEMMHQLRLESLQKILHKNREFSHIIAFRPTGWAMKPETVESRDKRIQIVSVPYSEHSSYNELLDFVQSIKRLGNNPRYVATVSTSHLQTLLN